MLRNRTLLISTSISLLFHVTVLLLAYLFPSSSSRRTEVMEVDVANIPRSEDFLPSKPGVIENRRPAASASPKIPRNGMSGRVPDLPVKTDLPPEKAFPASRPKTEKPGPEKPGEERQAKAAAPEQPKTAEPQGAPEKEPPISPGSPEKESSSPDDSPRTLRDITPSLGKLVMARNEPSGGRGKGDTRGGSVGTGGKASASEGVVEESGSGFRLTPLNAPEIQYISYFASIKRKIELVWQYPYDAAMQGIHGSLQINFTIGRDGRVESIELIQGSGYKILDDEAIRSIRKAAPFNPIPEEYNIPHLQIQGRFVYTHGGKLNILR